MKTRSTLVYCPGYAHGLEVLMPRRRLAALAGSLLEAGHHTQIWDFGQPEYLARLYPKGWQEFGQKLADSLYTTRNRGMLQGLSGLVSLRKANRAFRKQRHAVCRDIGERLAAERSLDFVVFDVDDREDVEAAKIIAEQLKALAPQVRVALTGPIVVEFPSSVSDITQCFDCLCLGDEETTLPRWAEALWDPARWEDIPNLAFRRGKRLLATETAAVADLSSLPEPVYEPDVYEALEGHQKLHLFEIEDSRGCACRCNQCAHASRGCNRLRLKPVAAIREELKHLDGLYGSRAFHFAGQGAPASHAVAVGRTLEGRQKSAIYSRSGHVAYANPAAFETLRASGCRSIEFQIDTGSQRLMDDFYGNGLQVSKVERVLRAARESGLFTIAGLTYPAPDDDYHTRAETLRLLERTRPDAAPVLLPEAPEHSRWRRAGKTFGFRGGILRESAFPLPGEAVFPFVGQRWRLPATSLGALSPSQAVRSVEELEAAIESLQIGTLCRAKMAVVASVMKRHGEEEQFARDMAALFMRGAFSAIAAATAEFNAEARDPSVVARFTPLADLRTAVGD